MVVNGKINPLETDKNINDKYEIPSNFVKVDEYFVDNIKVYEIYKKK